MVLWFTTWYGTSLTMVSVLQRNSSLRIKMEKNLLIQVLDDGIHNDIEVYAQLV